MKLPSSPISSHTRTYMSVGVGVAVRKESSLLLTTRKSNPTQWTIPSGYVEGTELLTETAVREVLEETGIQISPPSRQLALRQKRLEGEVGNVWVILLADWVAGEPAADAIELAECAFVPLTEIGLRSVTPMTSYVAKVLQKSTFEPALTLCKIADDALFAGGEW